MQINYYGKPEGIARPKTEIIKPEESIANTLIERMFFACATDTQVAKYYELLEVGGHKGRGLATSYASRIVMAEFSALLSARYGLDYKDVLK